MSFNQSRSDKNDSNASQYRKSGRSASFNQHRSSSSSTAYVSKGSGPPPAGPASANPPLSSNRSFKKSTNVQGAQSSRINAPTVNYSDSVNFSAPRNLQNGAYVQPSSQGRVDLTKSEGAPAASVQNEAAKSADAAAAQRNSRVSSKPPIAQPVSSSCDHAAPKTPVKASEDSSKTFAFQFGSISPGFMNGMQIPARTNSAPPNLDEQKRDQARANAHKVAPSLPTSTPTSAAPAPPAPAPAPKHPLPRKDMTAPDQSNVGESNQVPKVKKDAQVSQAPTVSQTQKPPVLPIPMASMQMSFHQQQVPVHFVGPNPQMQPQGVPASSLQMPIHMPLAMANPHQPLFVQPHQVQPQGMLHQSQVSYTTQMGPRMPTQLGTSQYPQQPGGKFGGPRKTVKITDPKTHEELRLEKRPDAYADGGSTGLRSHPNMPQSQPIPSFPPTHPMYYRNSYNANNVFYQGPGALPVSSSQMAPGAQPPRFNYPVNLGPQNVPFGNPPHLNSLPITRSGTVLHTSSESAEHGHDVHNVTSVSSGMTQVTAQPSSVSNAVKVADPPSSSGSKATGGKNSYQKTMRPSAEVSSSQIQTYTGTSKESSLQQLKSTSEKLASKLPPEPTKLPAVIVDSVVSNSLSSSSPSLSEDSIPAGRNEESKTGALSRSNSVQDQHKKPGKEGLVQHQDQGDGQTVSVTSSPLQSFEHGISANGVSENVEDKSSFAPVNREQLSELSNESVSWASDVTTGTVTVMDTKIGTACNSEQDDSFSQEEVKHQIDIQDQRKKQDGKLSGTILAPTSSDSVEQIKQSKDEHSNNDQKGLDESSTCHKESSIADENDASASQTVESSYVGKCHGDQLSASDVFSGSSSDAIAEPHATTSADSLSEMTSGLGEGAEHADGGMTTVVLDSKDRPIELARSRSTTVKLKKKIKEIYQKADALGTTSDLYTAYKGPEEKKENLVTSETTESLPTHAPPSASEVDPAGQGTQEQVKAEPEDWEDAADIPSPKLTSGNTDKGCGQVLHQDGDGNTAKKYSRDFLLKFSEQCTDLPQGFTISSEIAEAFPTGSPREPNSSPGRNIDRSSSGSRLGRRVSGMAEDERWNKMPGPFVMGKDIRLDLGFGGAVGFRPGQGNYGNLRNLRPQAAVPYVGGILPGPMQSMGPQGMIPRTGPDADRWQRTSEFHRGLIPSPHAPMQIMHKAEKKYEVGKVTDEEEAKQRQLKAILNKLTPQNFEKLFEQVKEVNIDNSVTLNGVISQIFDKALMEPTFCEMYANFCAQLSVVLPDFSQDNEKITFKRLLLNKCQEEFERNEREQEEANKADEEGEIKQSNEEREEKRIKARRQMLGNIRLIGELFKKKMLTERIMHECINKLLGQSENPDEEDVESLCKLMSTIGEMIDRPKVKEHMDAYFEKMTMLSNNMKLSSRVRFMLKDAIDLRKNKWQQRRKVEGPKKIEEVHRDAAQERHLQTSRLARNPSMNPSARRGAMDFGPRGSSMLPSPNAQMGGFRGMASPGMASPVRGYATQDFRFEDSYGAKTFPLPQRIVGDDSITLGPQGGLARGMATRGPPASAISLIADGSSQVDSRRVTAGVNNFSGMPDRPNNSTREDFMQRNIPDRFALPTGYDQVSAQDRNMNYRNWDSRTQDQGFGRSHATTPSARVQEPEFAQNIPTENVSEEYLRAKSLSAIKEFYSARDEEEVAMCIEELNAPSFHPLMISLWVTDSFERKDMERELLAKLLINLARSRDDIFTPAHLVKGFESVLTTLEDAVNDAPKAPEFLGRVFAKAVLENVVTLREIGRLLQEGGEEPGCLLEFGLAGDVLGSTLEGIKVEKGEGAIDEVRKSSGLRLEDFRPPDPSNRSKILEKFL